MSSQIGKILKISLFGESHGNGIGAVIDGFPAGVHIDMEELLAFMKRRAPGRDKTATPRKEDDLPEVLSGILDDVTCGTPIAAIIRNTNQHSADYRSTASIARPGHADYTGFVRYDGFNDIRGGGHFSARITAPLTFAGGLCKQYLASRGIFVGAHLIEVGGVSGAICGAKNGEGVYGDADICSGSASVFGGRYDSVNLTAEDLLAAGKRAFPADSDAAEDVMRRVIEEARLDGDSVGGVVEVGVVGLPAGVGAPIFDTIEGRLAYGYYGIPAVKGVEFGAGFGAAALRGSENNDSFFMADDGSVRTRTNNHGGALGGISSGMPVIARLAFKPTPSIAKRQESVDYLHGENAVMEVKGRHDPCVAVRAVPVVEAVTAIVIMDMLLESDTWLR